MQDVLHDEGVAEEKLKFNLSLPSEIAASIRGYHGDRRIKTLSLTFVAAWLAYLGESASRRECLFAESLAVDQSGGSWAKLLERAKAGELCPQPDVRRMGIRIVDDEDDGDGEDRELQPTSPPKGKRRARPR